MDLILANIAEALPALVPILYTLLVAAFLDFLTGIYAAWRSGTLKVEFIAEFVRSHLALKVTPILMGLVAGVAVGGTDSAGGAALVTAASAGAAIYLASSIASIAGNLGEAGSQTKGLPTGIPAKTPVSGSGGA